MAKLTKDLSRITVLRDTREQTPLPFPKTIKLRGRIIPLKIEDEALDAGDYTIKGYEDVSIVERKGSITELAQNFLDPKDSKRQAKAFNRLKKATRHPILFCEVNIRHFTKKTKYIEDPSKVLTHLCRVVASKGFQLVFAPPGHTGRNRRSAAELLTVLMATYISQEIR